MGEIQPLIGERIAVRGTSGSGKTTLAHNISIALGIPHIELDALFWKPNWTETPDDEFAASVDLATRQPQWVICGGFTRIRNHIDPRTDTLIWLDYPFMVVFWQLLKRTVRRGAKREMLWGHSQERLWSQFFTKQSILWWMITTHGKNHERCELYFVNPDDSKINHRFRHPRDTEIWLNQVRSAISSEALHHSSDNFQG
ncbi:MAG: hypothetical protein KF824_08705 [Fimbriimonadaceae bacterium]|nr:MAG: hypothetical protein KF824_08705 [Fimbriimonadaceae bacterium]